MDGGAYPHELEGQLALADGTVVLVRPIVAGDAAALERMFYRLSAQSLYRRFLTIVTAPDPRVLRHLSDVDYVDRLALVAVADGDVRAVARYERLRAPAEEADVAVLVEDAWHGRGLATALLSVLGPAARARGVRAFTATVAGDNRPMLALVRKLAGTVETTPDGTACQFRIDLEALAAGLTKPPPPAGTDVNTRGS